jgi:predicted dehydrogenase
MLKIAIVGMGGIGNTHARCYQDNRHTRIVATCDIIREKADAAAELYGAQAFYSIKEMIASGIAIDAASMCTKGEENGSDHYKPTMELLEAGIPTLGEKPISNSIPEARRMVALSRKKRVPYAVNLNHRFTPAALRAKQWLDKGRLGELNIVNMTMWINNPAESSPWFHIRALHPHSMDVMRYFAGDFAKAQCFFRKGAGRKIWSNLQANLLFKNGVLGHLTGSYDAGGSYKLWFYPRRSNEVECFEHLGGMEAFPDTFASRIAAWVDDVRKGTPPDEVNAKGEDALKVQLAIEACIKSWEEDKVVRVPQK